METIKLQEKYNRLTAELQQLESEYDVLMSNIRYVTTHVADYPENRRMKKEQLVKLNKDGKSLSDKIDRRREAIRKIKEQLSGM